MQSQIAIMASGLGKTYGEVTALQDAAFTVAYGEVFGYLGRNGSGKTTTVRILTTLTLPSSGEARVAGSDITRAPDAVRRSIGVTMQDAALDPQMTGREHLEFVLGLWGRRNRLARAEAETILEEFGLAQAANRLIGTYSGGMQRRLDLASALVNDPRVLFLDEPTTGLDAQSRRAVWERVRGLREEGSAVFLTTQYLEEADELADRLAVLDGGRIVATGTPDDLRQRHGATTLHVRLADGATVPAWLDANPNTNGNQGWLTRESNTVDAALDTLTRLQAGGVEVEAFRLDQPSLEDAFIGLTGAALEPNKN